MLCHATTLIPLCLTSVGMVLNARAINKQQATVLGMLTSQAGLAAMQVVLSLQPLPKSGFGAVPRAFWNALLARIKEPPPIFSDLSMWDDAPGNLGAQNQIGTVSVAVQGSFKHCHATPAVGAIEASIRKAAAGVLGTEQLDPRRPLAVQGLDSLASLELRHRIQVDLRA